MYNLGGAAFINTPKFLNQAAARMKETGIKPEIEVFDLGMLVTALRMRGEGKLDDPLHIQFVLGTPCGAPATPKALLLFYEHLPPNAHWFTTGIGRGQWSMATMAMIMGGTYRRWIGTPGRSLGTLRKGEFPPGVNRGNSFLWIMIATAPLKRYLK